MRKENLTHRITIRMDDDLYRKITDGAKSGKMPQVEFARRLLQKGRVIVKEETVADIPELKQLLGEFGKIGSNLNQIAHYFNGGGTRSREIYDGLQKAISQIYQMKFDVEKMGGEFRGYSKTRIDQKQ